MSNPAIVTQALTRKYGPKTAVNSLDLSVEQGEIFGLLGHNGAGKTTTVTLLTTLLEPTSGSATVAGIDVRSAPHTVRTKIGYLPENVRLYDNLTMRENLRFFGRLSGVMNVDRRISDTLDFLEFTGHEDERLSTFSKGMRQRVGIAQAILHQPSVLFLDEPTSGLDPQGVKILRETIVRMNRELGMTIFMNTHLLSEVTKTCTSIGVLRNGHLVYQASLADAVTAFPGEDSLEQVYLTLGSQGDE
ncbi:ABC transporter ATP-binding protein [Subtercola boreus]|uniref:ABC transporter ATP-binding protein n=1 Tax=Subtercola boreus TaxID=120213 RepID=A0A3E0VAI5_9MICO|nr:ABC transporter ATP-binding protein [Subtercola boreus]RFA06533.1 ABC transporter ATP-binding protein [Subtercola boreus]TQL46832.1 ABC-2 type transport system ATP-binding protein [Subtercola boreus]